MSAHMRAYFGRVLYIHVCLRTCTLCVTHVSTMLLSLRRDQGMQTHFDEMLNVMLQPALVAYELDR